jgi:tetratricopeptide (TPR) repeat protein
VLRGTWLEQLPGGDLRISPLLTDIVSDVPAAQARDWRRRAAEYWLRRRTLDARTFPLCFWNAFWGDHSGVLMVLCNTIQTMPKERLRAAAALLSPMTALATDRPLYSSNPAVSVQLRLLQFDVADAVEEASVAGKVARRLMEEVSTIEHQAVAALTTHIAAARILMAESAEITPAERISYALALRTVEPIVRQLGDDLVPDPATLLPPQFKPGMDVADLLFSMITRHINSSADEHEAFAALDAISTRDRDGFIDAMSAIYEGNSVFVHSGWSRDQLEDRDMNEALRHYSEIAQIASGWGRPDIEVEVACARSIILDEGFKSYNEALATIDEAILRHGAISPLLRQKAKVLGHAGRDSEAVVLFLEIEDEVGAESSFDRALALRDGALSAARSSQFEDAIRLLDKALVALASVDGREAWSAGMLVDRALIFWRAGQRQAAVLAAADALEAVEHISSTESRQAERSHQYARAIIGLFFSEVGISGQETRSPFTFGDASALESNEAHLTGVELKPIADKWRILATVEASLGVDVGIDERSMAKQGDVLVGTTELLFRQIRYENAVRSGVTSESLRAGAATAWVARLLRDVPRDADGLRRIPKAQLTQVDPNALARDPFSRDMIEGLLLDAIVFHVLVDRKSLNREFLVHLGQASEECFGDVPEHKGIINAASGSASVNSDSPMSELYARAATISSEAIRADPSKRFYRDMMMIGRIATSFARNALAPAFAEQVASGWQSVIDHQRFLLRNPSANVPPIELVLRDMSAPTLTRAAALILAAAAAVCHSFGPGWQDMLGRIAGIISVSAD